MNGEAMRMNSEPRSQGSLLPALRSVGRVGENPGNEVVEQCVARCPVSRLVHSPGRPASVIT